MNDDTHPILKLYQWLEQYNREEEECNKKARQAMTFYLPVLRAMGVSRVLVYFDGSGDSGSIDRLEIRSSATAEGVISALARWEIPSHITEALGEAAYTVLPGGWEINEGSSGYVELDVRTGEMSVHIQWNPPDTDEGEGEDE